MLCMSRVAKKLRIYSDIWRGTRAFELFSVQIEKEMRNEVNRRVNCENANTNKPRRRHQSICLR